MENDISALLSDFVSDFENSEEVTRSARDKAERCRDYFDDKQLTADEESALKTRGQPPVVFNEIKPKVKTMLGLEKQTRKDPKAYPRNPQDEDAAQAATDAIRYVCDDSRWDDKRSQAAKNLAIEGTCAVMIGVKQTRAGIDPDIRRIPWDRFYYDPHSSDDDFDDAAFLGTVIWMDLADAKAKYPDAGEYLDATWLQAKSSDTYDDKPKFNMWADYKRKRVRLCEHYYREGGKWMFCIFTKAGFVVEPQDSPYLGEGDQPECPIKAISLYLDRDNNRYGEVQSMISPQDEINKRRSKSLHLINSQKVRVSPNVAQDPAVVRKEMARPDTVFVGESGDVEIFDQSDQAMGNLNLMQDAREHIHRTGANSALAGKDAAGQSGRAIVALQQGGMTEAADYLDCIRRLSFAVYRSVWCRVRQYWKEERWIRVTDNDMNVKFVGLNTPVTLLEQIARQMGVTKEAMPQLQQAAQQGDQQAAQMLQQLQQIAQDPRSQQVVATENNVTELDVDIIVDEGVDTPTVAAEQFDTLAKMIPGMGAMGQAPWVIEMLIQASALRNKDQLLKKMREAQESASQGPNQQMQLEAAQAQAEGEIEMQKATIKAASDIEVAKIKAETDLAIAGEKMAIEEQIALRKAEADAGLAERKAMLDYDVKSRVADATGETDRAQADTDKADGEKAAHMAIMQQLAAVVTEIARPKTKVPIRDGNGLIVGIREMMDEAA